MKLLSSLTSQAKQSASIILDDQTIVNIDLEFRDAMRGWFYSLSYPFTGWTLNDRRLVAGPNILRSFRNVIPFGLTCFTKDGNDPWFIDDFVSGRAQLYVLNPSDILRAEEAIHA